MTERLMEALRKQKAVLEIQGYKVAYICIYGSQNYGLDINTEEYKSDIDMKAVIVPTLDDLIYNSKPVSETVDTEWGQCDIKDIRTYTETMAKANPAYIETLFTPYHIVDGNFEKEFEQIFALRNDLVHALRCQFVRAMYGMMCEKEKALCHPYPTIAHKIKKWGYDGKQAHHIERLWVLMKDYTHGMPLEEAFMVAKHGHEGDIQLMMDFKLNRFTLDDAKDLVADIMNMGKAYKDFYLEQQDEQTIDYSAKYEFINLSNQIIKNKIIHEIRSK
jgi:predicted nucleotidyltransferase